MQDFWIQFYSSEEGVFDYSLKIVRSAFYGSRLRLNERRNGTES